MTERPKDLRYQVSADRSSASRRIRYVETNKGDADDCMLCQVDEGDVPIGESAAITTPEPAARQLEEDESDEQQVEQELLQAIENQLSAQQPPAAQAVLNKLTLVGHTREEIVQMMAQVLAWQINVMLAADRPFDMAAYEGALRALPQLPEAL